MVKMNKDKNEEFGQLVKLRSDGIRERLWRGGTSFSRPRNTNNLTLKKSYLKVGQQQGR